MTRPEASRRLLDSWAVLALLNDEDGADAIAEYLRVAIETDQPLLLNEINAGEIFYVVAKHRSVEAGERVLSYLEALPIQLVPNAFEDVIAAAQIKAAHPLSYADAFAVATAFRYDATVITGDREFEAVTEVIAVEWV